MISRQFTMGEKLIVLLLTSLLCLFFTTVGPVRAAKPDQPVTVTVTPNSDLAGKTNVEYKVEITLGKKSKIKKGDTITFFAEQGVLPSAIEAGKITVNGIPTEVTSKGDGKSYVNITSPVHINQKQKAVILFSGGDSGAGLTNPGIGEKSFFISSDEVSKSSATYTFRAASLYDLAITSGSNLPKDANVEYKFMFNTGEASLRTEDTVTISAPPGFFSKIPSSGAVEVNHVSVGQMIIASDGSQMELKLPTNIAPGEVVEVWFKGGTDGAGITNPDSGKADFRLKTNKHKESSYSLTFEKIVPQELQQLSVTPDSNVANETDVEYQIKFNTGNASLVQGDVVTVNMPSGVIPSEPIQLEDILVNGIPAAALKQDTASLQIALPINLKQAEDAVILINGGSEGAHLSNPGPGEWTFTVSTNKHVPQSISYTFVDLPLALSDFAITSSSYVSGQPYVEYKISFRTGKLALQKGDYVTFATSPGVFLNKEIPAGKITVNGVPTDSPSKGNANNYVKIIFPTAVGANQQVEIVFSGGEDGAGLRNPGIGTKSFTIITANYPKITSTLVFTGEPLRDATMDASPALAGYQGARFHFRFNTSPNGMLRVGDLIYVYAPSGVFPAQPIPAGKILVNGVPTTSETKTYKTYVTIYSPVLIESGKSAEVIFLEGADGANLRNPGVGTQKFLVWTTFDDRVTIPYTFSGLPVSNVSLSVASNAAGERNVEYTFRFTTGENGSLRAGNYIFVYAPVGVFPQVDSIEAGRILINGNPTSINTPVNKTYVMIPTPVDIGGKQSVEVRFLGGEEGANLRNPGDGMQKFLVWTAYDGRESITYPFVGIPVQNLSMNTSSTAAGEKDVEYTFQFTTSGNGDMKAGRSIIIYAPKGVFPQGSAIAAGRILINGNPTAADIPVNGNYVVIPSPIDIESGQAVEVKFLGGSEGAHLRNPGGGSQKFLVWTSYDGRGTLTYEFAGTTLQNLEMSVSTKDPLQANAEYRFTFQLSQNGSLNPGDLITVYTPPAVLPGSSIPAGKIMVNGVPTTTEAKGNGSNYVTVPTPVSIDGNQTVEIIFTGGEEGAHLATPAKGKRPFVLWTPYDAKATVFYVFGDGKLLQRTFWSEPQIQNLEEEIVIEEELEIPELVQEPEIPEIVFEE